jgi:hypothetical protein
MTIRLVKPGDPVEVHQTEDGRRFVALPSVPVQVKRSHETKLPSTPDVCNPISILAFYELYGLSDPQIMETLGFTQDQLQSIRSMDLYQVIKDTVVGNIKDQTITEVTSVFRDQAQKAASTIISNLDSNVSTVAMSAAVKVLDYAGISPKRGEIDDKMSRGLNIVIMNKD